MVTEIKDKAAIYCRVSTRGQKEEGTSLEGQFEFLKNWIETDFKDLDIKINTKTLEEHFSEDYTGTTFDRPVWNQVKALVVAGEIKHVFVYNMTRFARPQQEDSWMNVIEEMNFFKKHDVELHINDLKNEGLGALASIMTTFQVTNAHIDYADTVKKMLKGKKDRVILHKKAHTGRRFSLFGYDYISKRRNFDSPAAGTNVINDEEAKIVRLIFEEYVKGKSGQQIADLLNDRGIKTKTGKNKWMSAPIIRMIQDETYKGEAKANFHWNAGNEPNHEQLELGKDYAPAIVTKKLWNQAADINRNRKKVKTGRKFLLTDFIKCGLCNGNVSIRLAAGKYVLCHCSNHEHADYKEYCEMKDFKHETIAPAVWNRVMSILVDSRSLITALEHSKTDQSPVLKKELALLEDNLKQLPLKKKRIRESFIHFAEDMSKAEIDSHYQDLSAEESRITHRIQEIKILLTEIKKTEIAGIEVQQWMTDIYGFLNQAEDENELLEKKRYILSQLNIRVTVFKRNEDGTVDFKLSGILPRDTKNDMEDIINEIESNGLYPTTEQTSACSFFTWVNNVTNSNIKSPNEILSDNTFIFEEALAIENRTSKIYNAVGFRTKNILVSSQSKTTDQRVINLQEESELAYKLFLKNRNGKGFIDYRRFITMLHEEIDNNYGKKYQSRSNHFRILVNKYLLNMFPLAIRESRGKKYLCSKV